MLFAPVANPGPTVYWPLSHILADPELPKEIRKEVSKVTTISLVKRVKKASLDITRGLENPDAAILPLGWMEVYPPGQAIC
jgi:hypothetical protein